MTDIEFEYADYCVYRLSLSYPVSDDLLWYDLETCIRDNRLNDNELQYIRDILIDEEWIVRYERSTLYTLHKSKLAVLKDHGSYSNYYWYNEKIKNKKEQKDRFDFNVSKWKYYTFWWFFGLAIFGGGYSAYDFKERLSKLKSRQQGQIPKAEMESVESKSHTLTLDQKSLDSLHNSKTRVDSLKIK